MNLSEKRYNLLRAIALIWLPALGTFIFALSDTWGFAGASQIVGSIMALDAFLGVILGLSINTGIVLLGSQDPEKHIDGVKFSIPREDFEGQDEIVLKIKQPPES